MEINEPINVWVFFKKAEIIPYLFIWKNRRIKVDKINLVHTSKSGNTIFYHFSLSTGSNFYRICLDSQKLKWSLEAVEEE